MKLYDTRTEKKISLGRLHRSDAPLRLFVCGPTVYDHAHIGHARAYIIYDAFVRYLRSREYDVSYIQNITDIDDKIIDRAQKRNIPARRLARRFEREYYRDMKQLGIKSIDRYARATDYIPEIQNQIQRLLDSGHAYQTGNGIYFSVRSFPDYGMLSKQNIAELRTGLRIDPDPQKRDPLDFVIWKFQKHEDEPSWKSPWTSVAYRQGQGRPGWHIEDTAITEKHFGLTYDLHGGGMDLKFPHHEAEIALAESLRTASKNHRSSKMPFVRIWIHAGLLTVQKGKMSKSIGNVISIKDFLSRYSADTLRYLALSSHYRSPLNYTEKTAAQGAAALSSVSAFIAKLSSAVSRQRESAVSAPVLRQIRAAKKQFHAALTDDFNTPQAMAVLFTYIRNREEGIWDYAASDALAMHDFVREGFSLLGFSLAIPSLPFIIRTIGTLRSFLRAQRYFKLSDMLRQSLESAGYIVEDTPAGQFIMQKL